MDRYRIIGKTKQITSVYLKDKDSDKLSQHRIILGKQIEVDENQLTFHVDRLLARKQIQLVRLGNTPEVVAALGFAENGDAPEFFVSEETAGVNIVETQSEEAIAPRKRGRKKKTT